MSGEATMIGAWGVSFAPLAPWWGIGVLAALGLAILGLALMRGAGGAWWRGGAVALGLLALANPSILREAREPLSDIFVILADRSASQAVAGRLAQTDAAVAALAARADALPNVETRIVTLGREAGAEGGGGLAEDGTRLLEALGAALSDVSPERLAGVVMVTDGRIHDADEVRAAMARTSAPIHVALTGAANDGDRRITVTEAPSFGIVGEPVSVTFRVDDVGPRGPGAPTHARVALTRDGVERIEADAAIGEETHVSLDLGHGGETVLEIEVEPGPAELTLQNNRAALSINGVRDRLRVLLVSGEPHAGERTWRNLLKSDPAVDLVHFTILRPPEKQDGTPIRELSLIAFPTRELFSIKLHEFDLIIFDRYRRRGVLPLLYLGNVARYVEEGGALLAASGPDFAGPESLFRTPLSAVLPAAPTGDILEGSFRPRVTETGRRHPVAANLEGANLGPDDAPSWGRWLRIVDTEYDGAGSLMTGLGERPLLLLERRGAGRVAQLNSDHAWLWARGYDGGGPQGELLRRLAHWLMKEPDLEEEDLSAVITGGVLEITRRSLADEAGPVTVTLPSGGRLEVPLSAGDPGLFTGRVETAELGLHRLADGELTALAAAGPLAPLEFADVVADAAALQPVVEATGGAALRLEADDDPILRRVDEGRKASGDGWLGLIARDRYIVRDVAQTRLLHPALALLLIIAALFLAWRREGRA